MTIETHLLTQKTRDYRSSQRLPMRSGAIINNWASSGQSAVGAAAAGVLYAVPLYLPDTCRVNALICSVTTGSAGNARMGLYTDSGGYPATSLLVATEITTIGTSGLKQQLVNLTLPCGFYWGAIVFDSTPTMQEDDNASGTNMNWLGGTSGTDITGHAGITVTHAYDALPTPSFTGGGVLATTVQPRILMRIGKYGGLN